MRVLIFSDLHLHNWTYGATVDSSGMNSRLKVQKDFLDWVADYGGVEAIIFCGDLVHTPNKLDMEVIEVALSGLKKIAKKHKLDCFAILGNHDIKDASKNFTIANFFKQCGWNFIKNEKNFTLSSAKGTNLVPYCEDKLYPAREINFVSYCEDKDKALSIFSGLPKCDFIFTHFGVKNVSVGSGFEIPNEVLSPNIIPSESICFTGHYHRHQKVSDNLVVIGSPMQHTWGDSGDEKGVVILDTESKEWEFVPYTAAPKFVEIHYDEDDSVDIVKGNYIRVICDSEAPDMQVYREELIHKGAISVEFRVAPIGPAPEIGSINNYSQLNDIIESYEKELDTRVKVVGRTIREGNYEALKYKH